MSNKKAVNALKSTEGMGADPADLRSGSLKDSVENKISADSGSAVLGTVQAAVSSDAISVDSKNSAMSVEESEIADDVGSKQNIFATETNESSDFIAKFSLTQDHMEFCLKGKTTKATASYASNSKDKNSNVTMASKPDIDTKDVSIPLHVLFRSDEKKKCSACFLRYEKTCPSCPFCAAIPAMALEHNTKGLFSLFGLGLPQLQIVANICTETLVRYGLNLNAVSTATNNHAIMEIMNQYRVDFEPGGATLNSIRIAQWLIGVPKSTTFMGCINRDKFGEKMEKIVKDEGVHACFQYDSKEPTGSCAVCLTGQDRSLVAYLGAAKYFSIDHLRKPENRALLEKALYFYTSSFPLTVCPEAVLEVAMFAANKDRIFVYNLSAPFLCRDYHAQMKAVLPYVDILFGNDSEALAYSEMEQWGLTDVKQILRRLAKEPKVNVDVSRQIICTRGDKPTLVIKERIITEYPVISIDQKDIVDTTGAGDAFVGGFLAQLVKGGAIVDCIHSANYAANCIIQQNGCQLPDKPDFSHSRGGF